MGHLSDEQIAHRILACEIDILVDLNGLSSGTRVGVLSFRPAPVQATWLGFIGTTAMSYVDYVIADEFSLPPSLSDLFRERPLYLPHSFLPRDSKREIGNSTTRAEHKLPDGKFVFASFNNIYKLNSTMFECWCCGSWMTIDGRRKIFLLARSGTVFLLTGLFSQAV